MEAVSCSEARRSRTVHPKFLLVVAFAAFSLGLTAQAQQGSLADAARQARAQKTGQTESNTAQAQAVLDELNEAQGDTDAPGGFKTYNSGDYKVWVPAPYHVQGHDDAGIVLSGPNLGSKHPIVMLGAPVLAPWGNNDDAFQDAAGHFAKLYAQSANCTKTKIGDHTAYSCSMAAAVLLGEHVSGNAVFVRAGGNMYPLFCMAPNDSRARDTLNSKRVDYSTKQWAIENLGREDDDMKMVWQKCETFFGSIHFRGSGQEAAQADKSAPARNVAAAVTASAQQTPPPAAPSVQPASVMEPQSTVPEGFRVHAFNYCKSHNQCWDASVLVPNEAKLVSSDCNQYVFEIKVQGEPFLLLTGASGTAACQDRKPDDPSVVRWQQLVAPENQRAPGTSSTISDQQMSLDGKRAVVTKIRFRKNMADWVAKRAEIDSNGVSLVVGCMASKEHFQDGDEICSNLIESVRLP